MNESKHAQENPYTSPQTQLIAAEHAAAPTRTNETRWYFMQHGYQLGFLAGCCLVMYLIMRMGWQLPGYWLLMAFVYIIVALPVCIVGGLLLGAVAAITDRMLQDFGWRRPYQLLEVDD